MSRLNMAVIGLRGMGGGHARQICQQARARLAAVADIDEAIAQTAGDQLNTTVYTDYRRMLAEEPLDAVVIATPHYLHAPMTLDALEAGLHVLVEKPIALRISEADRMVQMAEDEGRILVVGHNYRTFPVNVTIKRLLDDGEIGRVTRVLWQWLENRTEAYYQRDIWRCTWRHAGGGVLMNQTSHDLDLMCWMLGKPLEVSAMVCNRGHKHEVEDTVVAGIRFEGDAYASVQLSTYSHCLNYRQFWGDRGMILMQDERNANVHTPDMFRIVRYHNSLSNIIQDDTDIVGQPETAWDDIDCAGEAPASLLESFINAIHDGAQPIADGKSASVTLELINAMILSGVRKKTVSLPIDRDEYDEALDGLIGGKLNIG